MKKKTRLLLTGFALLFVAAVLINPSILKSLGFGAAIPGSTVYVPRIGALWCEEAAMTSTQQWSNPSAIIEKPINGWLLYDFVDIPFVINNNLAVTEKTFVCHASYCEFDVPSLKIRTPEISCSQGAPIYDIYLNSKLKERVGWELLRASFYVEPRFFGQFISMGDGDTITVKASCPNIILPFTETTYTPYNMTFGYRQRNKQLVGYFDGAKIGVRESSGCLRGDISNAIRNQAKTMQPTVGTVLNIIAESITGDGKSTAQTKQEQWIMQTLPTELKVGEWREFIYEFKEIPSFGNVIALKTGERVYAIPVFKTVYKIKEITLTDGTKISVAGDIYKSNVQCVVNEDCPSTMQCDKESGAFTCAYINPPCSVDSQCGVSDFSTQADGSIVFISNRCVSGQCVKSQTTVVCNPKAAYPYNGCPGEKPECKGDGSECYTKIIPQQLCPFDCCLGDATYHPKDCAAGLICKTNGTTVGVCVPIPPQCVCGDGICCDNETKEGCRVDCGKVCEHPFIVNTETDECECSEGTHLVVSKSPIMWFGIIPSLFGGTVEKTTCEPDFPYLLIYIIIGLGAILIFFALYKGKRKTKKKGR